jgi:hypothetical protein
MAYIALFGAAGPVNRGAIAPPILVNNALLTQGATRDDIARFHQIEAAYNSQVVRRNYVGQLTNPVGCHLATFLVLQQAGKDYRRLALGARQQHINAHVAAYMVSNLVAVIPAGMQVSHLCHHGECVNPAHLLLETAAQNRARNICQGWTYLVCPCGCNHRFNPCHHQPQCILP